MKTGRCCWPLLLPLLLLSGCGYHPMGARPIGHTPRTLAVPLFTNRSTEVGLEAIMANALIRTFAQTRAVKGFPPMRIGPTWFWMARSSRWTTPRWPIPASPCPRYGG